jgi:hypothetical protein
MGWLNGNRIRILLVGIVVAIVFGGGGRAKAEITMSEWTNVGPVVNTVADQRHCDLSHDGLELYFSGWRPDTYYGKSDIYVARRKTINDPWEKPVNLGPIVNSSGSEVEPSISGDGVELYFACYDDWNLRVCTRPSKDAPWSNKAKIGPPVGSDGPAMEVGSNDAYGPDISADGLSLYFCSTRVGGYGQSDIWMTKRAAKNDPWDAPVNLGPNVNTGADDWDPSISTDGLTLVFTRGYRSMWASTRKSVDEDWGPAVYLGFPTTANFLGPALSPDGSTLYFAAHGDWGGYGNWDLWQLTFAPAVDFNGDGIVDLDDLLILVEHWGEQEALCDIGPLPLGDGVVDIEDLKVFIAEWEKKNLLAQP